MSLFEGLPYPVTVAALFLIVLFRANATYWLGRGAYAGASRTRLQARLNSPRFARAQRQVARWGAPVVTASFLTVGIQTVVNLAAGATRMPMRRYLPAVTVGCLLWALLYASVGFVTLAGWRRLYELSPAGAVAVLVLLGLGLAGYIGWQLRRPDPASDSPDPARQDDPARLLG